MAEGRGPPGLLLHLQTLFCIFQFHPDQEPLVIFPLSLQTNARNRAAGLEPEDEPQRNRWEKKKEERLLLRIPPWRRRSHSVITVFGFNFQGPRSRRTGRRARRCPRITCSPPERFFSPVSKSGGNPLSAVCFHLGDPPNLCLCYSTERRNPLFFSSLFFQTDTNERFL